MRSLLHVVRGSSTSGEELPPILPALTAADIKLRRGQLHVVAGQPGGGKTMLAWFYALTFGGTCLYFNADSDEGTMMNRAAATLLGKPVAQVERLHGTNGEVLIEDALFDVAERVRLQPDPHPSIDGIYDEVRAYIEVFSDVPDLIVIDNLMNVAPTSDNEWTSLRDAMSAFHGLAREAESAVLVLAHVSENDSKPNRPAPRRAVLGKVNQLPELICTVALDGDNYHIAAVKNRQGKADPNADEPITVAVDAESMRFFNTHQELAQERTRRQWQ
jgi:RecA-family ATPase